MERLDDRDALLSESPHAATDIDAHVEAVSYTHLDVYKRQGYMRQLGRFVTELLGVVFPKVALSSRIRSLDICAGLEL